MLPDFDVRGLRFRKLRVRQQSKQWQERLTELDVTPDYLPYIADFRLHLRTQSQQLLADGTLVLVIQVWTEPVKKGISNNPDAYRFRYKTNNADVHRVKVRFVGEVAEQEYDIPADGLSHL